MRHEKIIKEFFLKDYPIIQICREVRKTAHRCVSRHYVNKVVAHLGLVRQKQTLKHKLKEISVADVGIDAAQKILQPNGYGKIQEKTLTPLLKGCITKMDKYVLLTRLKNFVEKSNIKIVGNDTNTHKTLLYDDRRLTKR